MSSQLLTIPEVADRLRVRRGRAYQLVREGQLPCVRLGAQVRVDPTQLDEWIKRGGSPFQRASTDEATR